MKEIIYTIVTMLMAFFIIGGAAMQIVNYDCYKYAEVTGRDVKTNFGTCYVKTERGFIPRDELNFRSATHE